MWSPISLGPVMGLDRLRPGSSSGSTCPRETWNVRGSSLVAPVFVGETLTHQLFQIWTPIALRTVLGLDKLRPGPSSGLGSF